MDEEGMWSASDIQNALFPSQGVVRILGASIQEEVLADTTRAGIILMDILMDILMEVLAEILEVLAEVTAEVSQEVVLQEVVMPLVAMLAVSA
mmetsp:Transcript_11871/g.21856  ORF Transcript_11871/g.21856 Transcript_11871/m.21856 type:complete len:93 (-) Transcript_11871:99-377(-)